MKPKTLILVVAVLGAALAVLFSLALAYKFSHDFSNLHAEYSVEGADIGIPGITKMYDARLVNAGKTPVHIQICAFQDDVGSRGEAAAFSVQRYDPKIATWVTIVDASDARACHPYPLGWVTAQLKSRWLWPGQSVSMGEEATAARGFKKGESARFLLFTSFGQSDKNPRQQISTAAFVIDEEAGSGAEGLRVRH